MKKTLSAGVFLVTLLGLAGLAWSSTGNTLQAEVQGPGQLEIVLHHNGENTEYLCSAVCNYDLADGTQITISALPSSGARFSGWSGNCSRAESTCTLSIDPGVSGETITAKAFFEWESSKRPLWKKLQALRSDRLLMQAGCGGQASCSLEITGYLRGPKRLNLQPIYFDLRAREKRTLNILRGKANQRVRQQVSRIGQGRGRARLFVRLRDMQTDRSSAMAINEKPRCCWDKDKTR